MILVASVASTTGVWLEATFLTAPVAREKLEAFYRHVRPGGPGWRQVRADCGNLPPLDDLGAAFRGSVVGCVCVYATLFGTGAALLGEPRVAIVLLVLAGGAAMQLARLIRQVLSEA